MDYTELIKAVATVLAIVVSMFVIPWIKKHIDAATLEKIITYVEIFVAAAEQIFDVSQWEEKKQYVLQRLAEMNFKIDAEALDSFIEAEVLKLHHELRSVATIVTDDTVEVEEPIED